jgi:hypothetical protein
MCESSLPCVRVLSHRRTIVSLAVTRQLLEWPALARRCTILGFQIQDAGGCIKNGTKWKPASPYVELDARASGGPSSLSVPRRDLRPREESLPKGRTCTLASQSHAGYGGLHRRRRAMTRTRRASLSSRSRIVVELNSNVTCRSTSSMAPTPAAGSGRRAGDRTLAQISRAVRRRAASPSRERSAHR